MKKTIITGLYKHSNSYAILNGDIELNAQGEEIYIESTKDGERAIAVKKLPIEIQAYINEHKRKIEL